MIRELSALGASERVLARAFLCSRSLIHLVLTDQLWRSRPCDGCWEPISSQRTSGLCERCRRQFCERCAGPKPASRQSSRCVTCDRESWRQYVASREKICRYCGEALPETRRDVYCTECRADEDAFKDYHRQLQRQRDGTRCRNEGCENPVPTAKSWTRNTCRDCAKEHDRLRRSLSRRLCGICERRLNDQERGLCRECRNVDARIRRRGTENAACPTSAQP